MKKVKTYLVGFRDENGYNEMEIQALNAVSAVEFIGVKPENVVLVAVIMKDWKKSK